MNKKNLVFNACVLIFINFHIPFYAVSGFDDQAAPLLESAQFIAAAAPVVPIIAAAPVVAPIVSSSIPAIAGYMLLKLIMAYIFVDQAVDMPGAPPRDVEKIINPGSQIQLGKYSITNRTDKPIIYDPKSGKSFEASYSEKNDWTKGEEIKAKFEWKKQ